MDLNRDEMRRQLRDIDRDNRLIMPRWRETLERVFSGDVKTSPEQKAALLGVPSPSRRQAFRMGGATLLGAAVLAACGDDDDEPAETGDPATTTEETTTTAEQTEGETDQGAAMDLVLARTAASLEQLAVDAYTQAAESGLVETQAILDAATLFAEHHAEHREALNGVVTSAGGEAVTTANEAVLQQMVQPALEAASTEADVVALALDLENAAAQTYVFAAGELSTPDLRSTIMTIGGIEARHAAILVMAAQGQPPTAIFPDERAFYPSENPLPEDAILTG